MDSLRVAFDNGSEESFNVKYVASTPFGEEEAATDAAEMELKSVNGIEE